MGSFGVKSVPNASKQMRRLREARGGGIIVFGDDLDWDDLDWDDLGCGRGGEGEGKRRKEKRRAIGSCFCSCSLEMGRWVGR